MTKLGTALVSFALAASACTGSSQVEPTRSTAPGQTTSTASPTTATVTLPPETTTTTTVRPALGDPQVVYFFLDDPGQIGVGPFLVPVWRDGSSPQGLTGAIETLLAGPTVTEQSEEPGVHGHVPSQTRLLGAELLEGTAVIDLSSEFASPGTPTSLRGRLAQLVYTVTRLPDVDGIALMLDGEAIRVFSDEGIILDPPVTRDQFRDLQPPIFVDDPAYGAPADTGRIRGEAMIDEDRFFVNLNDADGLQVSAFDVPISGEDWVPFDVDLGYFVEVDQTGSLLVFGRTIVGDEDVLIGEREVPVQLLLSASASCSADGLSAEPTPQDLSEAVDATRAAIIEAATSCDWAGLGALADDPFFTYSFGEGGDPVGFWQRAEASGEAVTRLMVQLLNTPPVLLIEDFPEPTYLWPEAFAFFPVRATDLEPLRGILPDDELDAYAQFGEYLGMRLGISDDGTWQFAVAGD